jgi:hypothetical protein
MSRALVFSCAFLAAALLFACRPPSPVPVPLPGPADGGSGIIEDWPSAACAQLRASHCEEGEPPCEEVIRDAERLHIVDLHPQCLGRAKNAAELLACGPEISCTVVYINHKTRKRHPR